MFQSGLIKGKEMQKNSIKHIYVSIFSFIVSFFAFFNFVNINFCLAEKYENLTSAKSMIVIEQSSGRVLFSKNENEKLPMASTTKIITAIYVIEHVDDLDKVFEIPKEAVGIEGTSIGLKAGEHLSIRELLYGLMLRSGNDSAIALAIAVSGSEEKFVDEVNLFLHEIGLNNTHISNPHGLPAEDHFTTASDLARVTAFAMNNQTFREIVSTKEKKISNELESKFSRNLKNKNKILSSFAGANGVKTGFTVKAGRCFVGSAERDGMQLICVLLNCIPMFEDCEKLLEKGFENYSMMCLLEKGKTYDFVLNGKRSVWESDVDFSYPFSKSEKEKVSLKFSKKVDESGEECVFAEIYSENQLIFSHKIYTINSKKINAREKSNFRKIIQNM